MSDRLAWLSTEQLDATYDRLTECASIARSCRRFALSYLIIDFRSDVLEELNRRQREAAMDPARQLSIVPPGAYDGPA